ncbi:MAG: hypothetical protein HC824_20750 [Synechococcales cyanobacterium RM1_1_8]|nr:hypothetical protein [Synechococcales cyanobacterium RM1_1_8]
MSEIFPLEIKDQDGVTYSILIESSLNSSNIPEISSDSPDSGRESYGLTDNIKEHLRSVHGIIRAYVWYVVGAFKGFSEAEVDELTLKFGLKIAGKTGIPIFTEGAAESNFEVEVKCKFPAK